MESEDKLGHTDRSHPVIVSDRPVIEHRE